MIVIYNIGTTVGKLIRVFGGKISLNSKKTATLANNQQKKPLLFYTCHHCFRPVKIMGANREKNREGVRKHCENGEFRA